MLDAERLETADTSILSGEIFLGEPVVINILQGSISHLHHLSLVAERIVLRAHLSDEAREVILLGHADAFLRGVSGGDDGEEVRTVAVLRHLRFVDATEFVGSTSLRDPERLDDFLRRDVIGVPRLILPAMR